ncbi:flagellar motor switch protein FliM [Candidatus Gottesmanbacteria bacterium]|nr:flagellar motor switch protein FliM [Candidatus Gottesmanbacteria bacterium]
MPQEKKHYSKDIVTSEIDDVQSPELSTPLLSQDEIETLLNVVYQENTRNTQNSIINTFKMSESPHILPRRKSNHKDINIKEFELTKSGYLSKDCIKALRTLHNNYAEKLSSSFSEILSANAIIKCVHIEQLTYNEYIASLIKPSCTGIFSMKPSNSIGAIELSYTCVFSIIDKMLGGSGLSMPYSRPLTTIEETIIIKLLEKALRILRELWNQNTNVEMKLERLEKDPKLIRIASPESTMILVLFKFRLNDVCGIMSLCLPYIYVKESFNNINEHKFSGLISHKNVKSCEKEIQKHILNMQVNLSARYEPSLVTLGEFMELQKGDIVKLQKATKDNVVILIEGKRKFFGKPGVINGQRAIQIYDSKINNTKV